MGTKNHNTICFRWNIVMMLVAIDTIVQGLVERSQPLDKTKFGPAPRGTIKTIEVPEDGDMIDCVDIYKQPAFNDPLIKKDFQMIPSKVYQSLSNGTKNPQSNIIQNWNRYGDCPEGSIPIRRTWNNYNRTIHLKKKSEGYKHEYAIAMQRGRIYNGAAATFNTWNPRVRGTYEFSLTQLWILAERNPPINTIECGWIVSPHRYHDTQTRLFTYWTTGTFIGEVTTVVATTVLTCCAAVICQNCITWTSDNYNTTGCYDLDCAGFVQLNRQWTLGGVINDISANEGPQYDLHISVSRDTETGRWWLQVQGVKVGYFPSSKFTTLRDGADRVDVGGEIINQKPRNKHTGTYMGSGKFPVDGWEKASYVRNIQVISERNEIIDASLVEVVTRPDCYDLDFGQPETDWRTYFYYGGPGFSKECYTG